jgi:hypothetical protein
MSRRARSAPKANVSASVRLGLESIVEGNESSIRAMLSLGGDKPVVEGLVDCMGVSSISAEMLMANYFSVGMLSAYARERLGKSDKGGAATLAERIAREWAKPSFTPMPLPAGKKRSQPESAPVEDADGKRAAAMADLLAKRAKTKGGMPSSSSTEAPPMQPPAQSKDEEDEEDGVYFNARSSSVRGLIDLENSSDLNEAVQSIRSWKVTCEDVLYALVQWSNPLTAANFLRAWEKTGPICGCDMELMFEAVPRIRIKGGEAMTRAGMIVGSVFDEDHDEANALQGFWDVPDTIAEDDREAFMGAWRKAATKA